MTGLPRPGNHQEKSKFSLKVSKKPVNFTFWLGRRFFASEGIIVSKYPFEGHGLCGCIIARLFLGSSVKWFVALEKSGKMSGNFLYSSEWQLCMI